MAEAGGAKIGGLGSSREVLALNVGGCLVRNDFSPKEIISFSPYGNRVGSGRLGSKSGMHTTLGRISLKYPIKGNFGIYITSGISIENSIKEVFGLYGPFTNLARGNKIRLDPNIKQIFFW